MLGRHSRDPALGMNICLLTPQFPPYSLDGGVGHYVRALAEGYAARGHRVTVCGVDIHDPGSIDHEWGRSVSLRMPSSIRRGAWPALLGGLNKVLPAAGLGMQVSVKAMIHRAWHMYLSRMLFEWAAAQRHRFDVVEAPNVDAYTSEFPSRRPWPVVVRLSSPASECKTSATQETDFEARACATADLVISNTNANLDNCRHAYRLPLDASMVILHGIDDVPPQGASRSRAAVDFLSLARVERRKGLDILAEAIVSMLPGATACTFTFLGTTREQFEKEYPDIASRLFAAVPDAPQRVRFLGKVDEREKLRRYEASHYVLVPSRYESFCLVAVEALRAGTPFVAAPVGGLTDVARHAPSSLLVRSNTFLDWSTTLLRLAADGPAEAEGLRPQARKDYERQFSSARMIDESLAAYETLLRNRDLPRRGVNIMASRA